MDLLKSEYGMSLQEIRGCTRREISELLEAMVSRKKGWPEEQAVDSMKATDDIKARIAKARSKRFQGVNDGNSWGKPTDNPDHRG